MFALQPRMTIVVRKKLETDGLALIRTRWQLVVTDDDGNRREMNGRATVVSRRRADGTWGIVFDDPLSAA
jgi:ketosteroid isomerase-like protein